MYPFHKLPCIVLSAVLTLSLVSTPRAASVMDIEPIVELPAEEAFHAGETEEEKDGVTSASDVLVILSEGGEETEDSEEEDSRKEEAEEPLESGEKGELPSKEDLAPSELEFIAPTQAPPLPWSIQDFVTKYPQAISFALNYERYKDNVSPIDISVDMEVEGIPLFIQWDPRWGYRTYGSDFMGITGCGPTCLSMVVCGLTGNTEANPYAVACWSFDNGHYVYGAGTAWSLMTAGASHYGLCSEGIPVSADSVLSSLRAGRPVITSVGPGIFTYFGHFILLTGLDEDGKILLNDPNNPENSFVSWDASTIVSQAKAMWSFWVP